MKKEVRQSVLLVDDEPDVLESLSLVLEIKKFHVLRAKSGREALEVFSKEPVPVIICDNSLPDVKGIELLRDFRHILPDVQMIMVTGKGTIDIAVAAMKAGVFDFISKPVSPEHLVQLVNRARELYDALAEKTTLKADFERITEKFIIGNHPSVQNMLRLIHTVAPTDSTVLIEGESGTGKELVARMIHMKSGRSKGHFVAVDCGAIPEGLVESELFGYEKGAFTGAASAKPGKFERAHRGTLFLDEIASLPMPSQAKLLRALQEKVIERLGGAKEIPVDIRLVAASNVGLQDAVHEKAFRDDLYYRLNIVKIKIPALRERKSDILALSMHFMEKHGPRVNSQVTGISKEALKAMTEYSWPGNVRELENAVEHALVLARSPLIMPHDLPDFEEGHTAASALDEAERALIVKAIKDAGNNKYQAAKLLGIPRSSLYSKLKKFGIE